MTTIETIFFFQETGVKFVDTMPEGWKEIEGATTAPNGYMWINNAQPVFYKDKAGDIYRNDNYKHALLKIK